MAAKPIFADRARVEGWLKKLDAAVAKMDRVAAERVFEEAIPEFKSRTPIAPLAPHAIAVSRPPAAAFPER
jgi:O-antigen biosynthesis protein WbqV